MKIKHLIVTLCGLFCCACGRVEEPAPSSSPDGCRVQVRLVPREGSVSTLSRSLTPQQEAAVKDVNLYAVNTLTGDSRHLYLEGSSAAPLTLAPGTWDFYAVANMGCDLGEQSRESLEALTLETPDEEAWTGPGGIPMSARKRVEITGDASVTLELERLAARLQVNVGVAAAMSGRIAVGSVQLLSVPAEAGCFSQGAPQRYADYPAEEASSLNLPRTYYVAENLAGTVPEITRPQERSAETAPEHATCILISGTCDGRQVYYRVYPGGNTTSDFNIGRNRTYILNITLHGASPTDYRVSVHEMQATQPQGRYGVGQQAEGRLLFTASNNTDNTFSIAWEKVSGDPSVTIDGMVSTPGVFAPGLSGRDLRREFAVTLSSRSAGRAEVRFTVTDSRGETLSCTMYADFVVPEPLGVALSPTLVPEGQASTLQLSVAEQGYDGEVTVTFNEVSGTGSLVYGNTVVTSGTTLRFRPGNHALRYEPRSILPLDMDLTAMDDYGQSVPERFTVYVDASRIRFVTTLTYGNEQLPSDASGKSSYRGYADIRIEATTPQPKGTAFRFTLQTILYDTKTKRTSIHTQENLYLTMGSGEVSLSERLYTVPAAKMPVIRNREAIAHGSLVQAAVIALTAQPTPPEGREYDIAEPEAKSGGNLPKDILNNP